MVSAADSYATPFGEVPVARDIVEELVSCGIFDVLSQAQDENEHSIEMHVPFVKHVMLYLNCNLNPAVEETFVLCRFLLEIFQKTL